MDREDAQLRLLHVQELAELDDSQLGSAVARESWGHEVCAQTNKVDDGALAARGFNEGTARVERSAGVDLLIIASATGFNT